jgi:hypothetical protein
MGYSHDWQWRRKKFNISPQGIVGFVDEPWRLLWLNSDESKGLTKVLAEVSATLILMGFSLQRLLEISGIYGPLIFLFLIFSDF